MSKSYKNTPVEETTSVPVEEPVVDSEPIVVTSETPTASERVVAFEAPALNAQPVSGVPTPGAVSDPKPEKTDNRERPEDGVQDVSQDKNEVPSEDENPDLVA